MPSSLGKRNFARPIELSRPGSWRSRTCCVPAATAAQSTDEGGRTRGDALQSDSTSMPIAFSDRPERTFLAMLFRSEEHTSELQSLMRISYAVFCLKKKKQNQHILNS